MNERIGFVGAGRMVHLGLGELDKSGVAELTFRGIGPAAPADSLKDSGTPCE